MIRPQHQSNVGQIMVYRTQTHSPDRSVPATITEADLPPPDTKRWVTRRKAVIIAAVRSGVLTLEETCRRYNISVEEFASWERLVDRHGIPGLRTTRIQHYRDSTPVATQPNGRGFAEVRR